VSPTLVGLIDGDTEGTLDGALLATTLGETEGTFEGAKVGLTV
jgi:hypothetical protein